MFFFLATLFHIWELSVWPGINPEPSAVERLSEPRDCQVSPYICFLILCIYKSEIRVKYINPVGGSHY